MWAIVKNTFLRGSSIGGLERNVAFSPHCRENINYAGRRQCMISLVQSNLCPETQNVRKERTAFD